MLVMLGSTVVPVYLWRIHISVRRHSSVAEMPHLRNSISDRLVNTIFVESQSRRPRKTQTRRHIDTGDDEPI